MNGFTAWVDSIQQRLDSWARHQRNLVTSVAAPLPQVLQWRDKWQWQWRWPWQGRKEELDDEYKRRKEEIQKLCHAIKAEDITDLSDILSAMILSECVYKRPDLEAVRAINKFRADFGGQLTQLERVQLSLDHVPHRYLLAESGDTLFASFIGTKQYRDILADANILQGALFHEDGFADHLQTEDDIAVVSTNEGSINLDKEVASRKIATGQAAGNGRISKPKPAAHRGFLARARGIPAIELYRLAKKKDRRLVLCGHSLGGAVAVLATIAILKVLESSSQSSSLSSSQPTSKNDKNVPIKCITFSQPPVGNAALRDYVHEKGWHTLFRTYCIPEDLVPRLLSPAYFHHYYTQAQSKDLIPELGDQMNSSKHEQNAMVSNNLKEINRESVVSGLGKLQKYFRRISMLVPLANSPRPVLRVKNDKNPKGELNMIKKNLDAMSGPISFQDTVGTAAALESISQVVDAENVTLEVVKASHVKAANGMAADWRNRVLSLPSYVPFGQLFLLGKSSVEQLSTSEFNRLSSMQSVFLELRDRFQSHSMRSYRSCFQKIYNVCIGDDLPPNLPREHSSYIPHLQKWLGFPGATLTELGKIAEPMVIHCATSLVPVGWTGVPGRKKGTSFKVDLCGSNLLSCTLVKARVNGQWCSATMGAMPVQTGSSPHETLNSFGRLQKVRVRIGSPIEESLQKAGAKTSVGGTIPQSEQNCLKENEIDTTWEERFGVDGPDDVIIHCSSDFNSVSKKVVLRLRRVRLLGLEGAGKTSLYYALLGQNQGTVFNASDGICPDVDQKEGISEGVVYVDPMGINLQDLQHEVDRLKQELSKPSGQLGKKVDLVILVHNLAHKIPRLHQSMKPALSVLMNEVDSARIPHILAITNKFAVSADRRESAANRVMETYGVSPSMAVVINSCPYSVYSVGNSNNGTPKLTSLKSSSVSSKLQGATHQIMLAPITLVQIPFRRKEVVLPVEGVKTLKALVNQTLLDHEDDALMEMSTEQLLLELKNEMVHAVSQMPKHNDALASTATLSALGAGLGLVVAVVAAATSSLRKP